MSGGFLHARRDVWFTEGDLNQLIMALGRDECHLVGVPLVDCLLERCG